MRSNTLYFLITLYTWFILLLQIRCVKSGQGSSIVESVITVKGSNFDNFATTFNWNEWQNSSNLFNTHGVDRTKPHIRVKFEIDARISLAQLASQSNNVLDTLASFAQVNRSRISFAYFESIALKLQDRVQYQVSFIISALPALITPNESLDIASIRLERERLVRMFRYPLKTFPNIVISSTTSWSLTLKSVYEDGESFYQIDFKPYVIARYALVGSQSAQLFVKDAFLNMRLRFLMLQDLKLFELHIKSSDILVRESFDVANEVYGIDEKAFVQVLPIEIHTENPLVFATLDSLLRVAGFRSIFTEAFPSWRLLAVDVEDTRTSWTPTFSISTPPVDTNRINQAEVVFEIQGIPLNHVEKFKWRILQHTNELFAPYQATFGRVYTTSTFNSSSRMITMENFLNYHLSFVFDVTRNTSQDIIDTYKTFYDTKAESLLSQNLHFDMGFFANSLSSTTSNSIYFVRYGQWKEFEESLSIHPTSYTTMVRMVLGGKFVCEYDTFLQIRIRLALVHLKRMLLMEMIDEENLFSSVQIKNIQSVGVSKITLVVEPLVQLTIQVEVANPSIEEGFKRLFLSSSFAQVFTERFVPMVTLETCQWVTHQSPMNQRMVTLPGSMYQVPIEQTYGETITTTTTTSSSSNSNTTTSTPLYMYNIPIEEEINSQMMRNSFTSCEEAPMNITSDNFFCINFTWQFLLLPYDDTNVYLKQIHSSKPIKFFPAGFFLQKNQQQQQQFAGMVHSGSSWVFILNGTIGSVKKNSLNLTLAFETIAPIAYSFLLHLTLTRDAFGLIQCTKALSLHAEQTGRPSSNQFPFHVEFLHSPQPNSLMAVMPLVILSSNFRIGLYSPQEMEHDGNCQSEGGCSELVSQCGESFECLTIANCLRTKIIDQDLLAIDTFIRTNSTSSLDITLAWKQCLLPDGESNGSSGIDSGSSDGDGGDGVEMFLSSLHCSINYRCGIASVSNLMASLQKQRIILKYIPKSHLIRFPYDFTGQIQFLLEIKDKSTTRTVQEISTDKIYLIAVALQEMYEELDVRSARTEVGITQNSLEGMFQLTINYFYNTPLPYVNLLLLDSSSLERTNDIGGGSPQASSIQTVNEDSLSIIKESII